MAGIEIVEIPPDIVSEVGLEMLVAADGVAGLGACVDTVEMLRAVVQVESKGREMVVPVGVLDDHLALGIDCVGGAEDHVLSRILHQLQAILRPAAVTLCLDAVLALAVMEKEVIQDDLVKQTGGIFGYLFGSLPFLWILVTVCLERVSLAYGIRDAARYLQSLAFEELDGFLHGGTIDYELVAVRLEIDLVHLHLGGDDVPCGVQPMLVRHPLHLVGTGVDGYLEILVVGTGLRRHGCSHEDHDCDDVDKVFHGQCSLTTNIRYY